MGRAGAAEGKGRGARSQNKQMEEKKMTSDISPGLITTSTSRNERSFHLPRNTTI